MTLFVTFDCQYRAQKICGRCVVKTSKRTLAAGQKLGKVGSKEPFAAQTTKCWFEQQRRTLSSARTGK
ncbi:hypothetical protein OAI26_09240, partial [Sulfitobacter sp.]|nr:hypothetical protein [Sulfitobacter sp.]